MGKFIINNRDSFNKYLEISHFVFSYKVIGYLTQLVAADKVAAVDTAAVFGRYRFESRSGDHCFG
jgi:hypothetical protein